MANTEIQPHRITKPIQLLAAWLAGLAIIDATFLTAAANITTPPWIPYLLTIVALIGVSRKATVPASLLEPYRREEKGG